MDDVPLDLSIGSKVEQSRKAIFLKAYIDAERSGKSCFLSFIEALASDPSHKGNMQLMYDFLSFMKTCPVYLNDVVNEVIRDTLLTRVYDFVPMEVLIEHIKSSLTKIAAGEKVQRSTVNFSRSDRNLRSLIIAYLSQPTHLPEHSLTMTPPSIPISADGPLQPQNLASLMLQLPQSVLFPSVICTLSKEKIVQPTNLPMKSRTPPFQPPYTLPFSCLPLPTSSKQTDSRKRKVSNEMLTDIVAKYKNFPRPPT